MRVRDPSPEQVAAWEARGPEPFVVEVLPGWTRRDSAGTRDQLSPNERLILLERGRTVVTIMRWWNRPLHPGGRMETTGGRPVLIDGRPSELLKTSVFGGAMREVEVTFFNGPDWCARIVFDGASPADVSAVLGAIRFLA